MFLVFFFNFLIFCSNLIRAGRVQVPATWISSVSQDTLWSPRRHRRHAWRETQVIFAEMEREREGDPWKKIQIYFVTRKTSPPCLARNTSDSCRVRRWKREEMGILETEYKWNSNVFDQQNDIATMRVKKHKFHPKKWWHIRNKIYNWQRTIFHLPHWLMRSLCQQIFCKQEFKSCIYLSK